MRYLALLLLLAGCDQVTNVHHYTTQVSPTVIEAPHVCTAACPPSHAAVEAPKPVPPSEPVCDEAFKVRDHTQWVNACGTSADKEPLPPAVVVPPKPVPPSCRTAKGGGC